MIQHILLWRYREGLPVEEAARLMAELEALPGKVPPLRAVTWGPVVGGRNQSFSHGFVMRFDNRQGVEEYAVHPDHVHFAVPFREACETQVVTDIEVADE